MLDTLIILRHGEYNESNLDGVLNETGRSQIKTVASLLSPIINLSKPVKYFSSKKKRTIQSAMLLSQELGNRLIPEASEELWTKIESGSFSTFLADFYKKLTDLEGSVIIVGHKELLQFFPNLDYFKDWNGQKSLDNGCGKGYYFDIKNKTYRPLFKT